MELRRRIEQQAAKARHAKPQHQAVLVTLSG